MKSFVVVVALFSAVSNLHAGGSKIKIMLQNDKEVRGELLSVRDDALVIATKEYTEYTVKPDDRSRIAIFKFDEIKTVEAPGSSYTWLGLGVGFLGGLVVTSAVMSSQETETMDMMNASFYVNQTAPAMILGGGILGAGVGGAIGSIASTPDVKVIVGPSFDFATLKSHSRYPEGEPEVLQAVQHYSSLE